MISTPALILAIAAATPAPPQSCGWAPVQDAPLALVEVQSVVLDDKLYFMGGFFSSALKGTARTDVYDPSEDSWTRLSDMLTVVTHHTAAVDGQRIWTAGGFFGDNGGFVVNDVQVYDVATDSWSFGPVLPARRAGGGMVRLGRKLHYFGGFSTRRLNADNHYVLDLDNLGAGWDSSSYAPLPMGRGQLSAVELNGSIYAIGGQFGHDLNPIDVDLVHRYDLSQNSWTQVASLPTPRSHMEASSFAHEGRIYVAGGRNNRPGGQLAIQQMTMYDPLLDAWSDVYDLPVGLVGPSAKPIDGVVYVCTGGLTQNTPVADQVTRFVLPSLQGLTRINAGGPALKLSRDWCKDLFFVDGVAVTSPVDLAISGTSNDALYRSERSSTNAEGNRFRYSLPAGAGDYRLALHFAELALSNAGERVFDVSLEGALVMDDYDIIQAVGSLRADVHSFDVEVSDGFIDLDFEASTGQAKLSALEVYRLPDDSFGVYCQGAPNSVGSGARLGFVGSTSVSQGNIRLQASGLPPSQMARFAVGTGQGSSPFGNGTYCLAGSTLFSPILLSDASGTLSIALPSAMIPVGPVWNFQVIYLDNAPFRFNASDALQLRFTL